MKRFDLIIFLVAVGWMALKFIGAWLEQRAAGRGTKDADAVPAGEGRERRRPPAPPPVLRRPRTMPPAPPVAAPALPGDSGELQEWLRKAMAQSRPAPVPPPFPDPLVAEAEREGLEHQAAAPLDVMEDAAARPPSAPASGQKQAAAALLRRGTRQRLALRQGILMAEVLARPRAFDV